MGRVNSGFRRGVIEIFVEHFLLPTDAHKKRRFIKTF